jgi:hypothetical protein
LRKKERICNADRLLGRWRRMKWLHGVKKAIKGEKHKKVTVSRVFI